VGVKGASAPVSGSLKHWLSLVGALRSNAMQFSLLMHDLAHQNGHLYTSIYCIHRKKGWFPGAGKI